MNIEKWCAKCIHVFWSAPEKQETKTKLWLMYLVLEISSPTVNKKIGMEEVTGTMPNFFSFVNNSLPTKK